jgi:opacity protein-like surface antigen
MVFGVRATVAGADINGASWDFYCTTSCSGDDTVKIDWLATLTGRIGWTGMRPDRLVYIQGGLAWAHNRLTYHPSSYAYAYIDQQSRFGWTVGFGLEQMLTFWPGASAFVEANWVDLGSLETTPQFSSYTTDVTQSFGSVIVGLNFRLGH